MRIIRTYHRSLWAKTRRVGHVQQQSSLRFCEIVADERVDPTTGQVHAVRTEDDIEFEEMWEDGYGAR